MSRCWLDSRLHLALTTRQTKKNIRLYELFACDTIKIFGHFLIGICYINSCITWRPNHHWLILNHYDYTSRNSRQCGLNFVETSNWNVAGPDTVKNLDADCKQKIKDVEHDLLTFYRRALLSASVIKRKIQITMDSSDTESHQCFRNKFLDSDWRVCVKN